MSYPEPPIGDGEGAAPPVTVMVDGDSQRPHLSTLNTNQGLIGRTPFSPQMSADGSFYDNYADDSMVQSQSLVSPKAYEANMSQEYQPLFSSTSQTNVKPSQSFGGLTQISTDPQTGMNGAYSSNSLRERHYDDYSVSSHQTQQELYPWMTLDDHKEGDDDLHDPNKHSQTKGAPQRAILNIGTLILLVLAMLMLFAGYPILHHYTEQHSQDDFAAKMGKSLRNNNPPHLASGVPVGRANYSHYPAALNESLRMLIDPDTPEDAYELASTFSGMKDADGNYKKFKLVFSDEFNTEGRSFYPGEDPYWEAVDLHYWATGNYEWYDPAAVYTKGGGLHIRLEQHDEHNLRFRGGMVQTWNKFCYTGGILVASIQMPGMRDIPGLWPAFWVMGNLGRAGYGATLQGTWPYSYDQCDVGTTMNQTIYNSTYPNGFPADTLNGGATMFNQQHNTRALSFLPGQKLSACTCKGEDHPGPWLGDRYRGRSAPEIDVFEAQADNTDGMKVSQSCQMAPYNWLYQIDYYNDTKLYDFYDNYNRKGGINIYTGEVTQQSLSGENLGSQTAVQYEATSNVPTGKKGDPNFAIYSMEYAPGPDGYVAWVSDNRPSWELYKDAIRADPRSAIGARQFPAEPMNFGTVWWKELSPHWPYEMVVDWVRVYQDPDNINIGCDTKDYPTKDYIEKHIEAYTNANLTLWGNTRDEGGYEGDWPLNKLYSKGCNGKRSKFPGDPDQPELIAPVIPSKSVTVGVYKTFNGQNPTITKPEPNPTEAGAQRPSSAHSR